MRVVVAGVVIAAALATAGCSPGNWPTIAVLLVDGEPTVLAAPCSPDRLTRLVLSEHGPGNQDSWPQWRVQGDQPLGYGGTVQLLTTPDGWRATESTLTSFRSGQLYDVQAWGEQISFSVEFTLDDLRPLKAGAVWAAADHGDSNRAMPRQEFERSATSECHRR